MNSRNLARTTQRYPLGYAGRWGITFWNAICDILGARYLRYIVNKHLNFAPFITSVVGIVTLTLNHTNYLSPCPSNNKLLSQWENSFGKKCDFSIVMLYTPHIRGHRIKFPHCRFCRLSESYEVVINDAYRDVFRFSTSNWDQSSVPIDFIACFVPPEYF